MKFGSIQVTKKRTAGDCDHCKEPLGIGILHATVTIKARSKAGKHWFYNWHLHVTCIGIWLLVQLVARQDRRKPAGRPKGSGLGLSKEDKKKRLALLKRRVRLLQEVEACPVKNDRLEGLYQRFTTIREELEEVGGPAVINNRTTLDVKGIEKKLTYGRALHGQSTAG